MALASVSLPPGQPDIAYTPNFDNYKARTQKRLATEQLENKLPAGFPSQLKSDLVWDGHDIAEKYDWVYQLSGKEVDEIEEALTHFKCLHNSKLHPHHYVLAVNASSILTNLLNYSSKFIAWFCWARNFSASSTPFSSAEYLQRITRGSRLQSFTRTTG
jgi:hypothetical protein